MPSTKVECQIISADQQGASAQVRLSAGETNYLLLIGIRELVNPEKFDDEEIFLVDGSAPMSSADWCRAALSSTLEAILPYLTPQQELT